MVCPLFSALPQWPGAQADVQKPVDGIIEAEKTAQLVRTKPSQPNQKATNLNTCFVLSVQHSVSLREQSTHDDTETTR
jgi:hypothetical protein